MSRFTHKHALKILLVTNMVVLLAGYMFSPIYAIYVEEIGGDILDAGIASMIFGLAAALVTLISGRIADKIKETELVLVAGYLITAIGFWSLLFVKNMWGLAASQILLGFGDAITWPAFDALYSYHISKKGAGTAWGMWEGMNYFISAVGAGIGGVLVKFFGFKVLFLLMGAITFVSAIYILHLDRREL